MQWMNELEDAVSEAEASAVFVVGMPRIRSMQIHLGVQGMQHLADVMVSRVRSLIRSYGRYTPFVRYSGLELIVIVPDLVKLGEISALAEKIRQVCNAPLSIARNRLGVDCMVGVAISPDDGSSASELISKAQIAADNAISTHTKAPMFFAGPMAQVADLACRIEIELRGAIDNRAFDVVFQPQFQPSSKQFVAAEVLVRWDHPIYGAIPPGDFIPIAESAGLVRQLGSLVLQESVILMSEFRRQCMPLELAVNVSPTQLMQVDFVDEVQDLLGSVDMPPEALTVEITEGELLFDIDHAIHQLESLRKLGVRTSIDDFGAGFSNLAYLHRLPLDQIKIDRSFIRQLKEDDRSVTLLRSAIELGKGLGLEVCVEGVETWQQYGVLESLGCDLIQGYLFSRPVSITKLPPIVGHPAALPNHGPNHESNHGPNHGPSHGQDDALLIN